MSPNRILLFLNSTRIKRWSGIIIVCYLILLLMSVTTTTGILDIQGKPVGTDFITFYSASKLLQQQLPEKLYELAEMHRIQKNITNSQIDIFAWHYPPPFALIIYPLQYFNYYISWLFWILLTIIPLLIILKKIYRNSLTIIIFLAFPGTFQNIIHGQNGFLTAFLFGYGIYLLKKSPYCSGLIFGCLIYKPHFVIAVLPALVSEKSLKTLAGFFTSITTWFILTVSLWGISPWLAFIKNIPFAGQLLQGGALPYFKIPTVFSGAMMLGISPAKSLTIQLIFSLSAIMTVSYIWKKCYDERRRGIALVITALIASPFAFDYDLTILAPAIAWLLAENNNKSKRSVNRIFFC